MVLAFQRCRSRIPSGLYSRPILFGMHKGVEPASLEFGSVIWNTESGVD
jgi:hypothetical protein